MAIVKHQIDLFDTTPNLICFQINTIENKFDNYFKFCTCEIIPECQHCQHCIRQEIPSKPMCESHRSWVLGVVKHEPIQCSKYEDIADEKDQHGHSAICNCLHHVYYGRFVIGGQKCNHIVIISRHGFVPGLTGLLTPLCKLLLGRRCNPERFQQIAFHKILF